MGIIKKSLSVFFIWMVILSLLTGCSNANDISYPDLEIETIEGSERIYDRMDYVFVPDDRAIDKWEAVNIVQNIADFDPVIKLMGANFPWRSVEFFKDGTAELQGSENSVTQKWTRGYILNDVEEVIPSYTIKQLGGTNYMFIEKKDADYTTRGQKPWFYVFKKATDPEPPQDVRYALKPYDDARAMPYRESRLSNLSLIDFMDLGENVLTLMFNEKTTFPPEDSTAANERLQLGHILEAGKNPGLGIRSLHERGITGKGVTVAIIDQPLYVDSHPEYRGKIIEYKDFDCQSETSMHGPAVTSLLVGETTGTAPGANVYYAAAPTWRGDAAYYADALDWIVETNKNLPDGKKIRVASISASTTPSDYRFINGEMYLESVKRAREAGILILDASPENSFIGSCKYNYDNPEDVTQCSYVDLSNQYPFRINSDILAPVSYRTMAEEYVKGDCSYQYTGRGGWSWAIPYTAGVLAMGWEVKPELTSDEIVKILFDTAYVDDNDRKYVNPTAFIDYLENN